MREIRKRKPKNEVQMREIKSKNQKKKKLKYK